MSTTEKHVTLPGIAHNQQDVYETADPPTSGEAKKYEDDSKSDSVDKLECGVGKSYDTFKNKAVDTHNTDFSDEVRQGFGTLPDCVPKENEGAAEDTLERYKRLKQEVADLLADMERLKTATSDQPSGQEASDRSESVGGAVSVEELKVLQQQLGDAGINKILGEAISPAYGNLLTKNLLTKLEAASEVTEGPTTASSSDVTVYELYHKPEAAKFTHLSKLSQLEERLAQLESVVGMEHPKPNVVSGGLDSEKKCIATRLASLHSKVALLDQSHVAAADMRLQGLLNSIKHVKKEQALLQAAESQSKVSEIYNAVQRWDSVASLLPDLIDRLHALRDLHQQATEFSNSIAQIGDEQSKITLQLNTDQNLLSQLKKTFATNMATIEANCKSLEARMTTLMK